MIPKTQYGGGTVLLGDRGTWTPEGNATAAYKKGRLKFRLHGRKLKGEWVLARREKDDSGKERWILFKVNDE